MFHNICKNIDRIWSKSLFFKRLIFIKMNSKLSKVIFLRFLARFWALHENFLIFSGVMAKQARRALKFRPFFVLLETPDWANYVHAFSIFIRPQACLCVYMFFLKKYLATFCAGFSSAAFLDCRNIIVNFQLYTGSCKKGFKKATKRHPKKWDRRQNCIRMCWSALTHFISWWRAEILGR